MHEVHADFWNEYREQSAKKNDRSKEGGNKRRHALSACGYISAESHRIENDSKNNSKCWHGAEKWRE